MLMSNHFCLITWTNSMNSRPTVSVVHQYFISAVPIEKVTPDFSQEHSSAIKFYQISCMHDHKISAKFDFRQNRTITSAHRSALCKTQNMLYEPYLLWYNAQIYTEGSWDKRSSHI